jgi:DNA modification methylase
MNRSRTTKTRASLEREWTALARGLLTEASALQSAERLARMKVVYEGLHPETKHGAAPKGGHKDPAAGSFAFVDKAADATGWGVSTISKYVKFAEDICAPARRLARGTTLANKVELLDGLGRLASPKQQVAVVTTYVKGGGEQKAREALRAYLTADEEAARHVPVLGSVVREGERNVVLYGDVLARLAEVPDESVQCVVTSPPFYAVRDFGTRHWFGGDASCPHAKATTSCSKCGAWRGQLGQEATIDLYIEHMVQVFAEVRRVLRADGVLWVEIGDSYNSGTTPDSRPSRDVSGNANVASWKRDGVRQRSKQPQGLPAKNLLLIPQRLAIALQADGWFVRAEIIWEKTTCLPESVTDRPTRSHSTILLLSKSERYVYDHEAIKEPTTGTAVARGSGHTRKMAQAGTGNRANRSFYEAMTQVVELRNIRSVWRFPVARYAGAHTATFPPGLPERCILAGSRPGDVVLDPFAGSGTTLAVAKQLGRAYVGIELNEKDCRPLIEQRLGEVRTPGDEREVSARKPGIKRAG